MDAARFAKLQDLFERLRELPAAEQRALIEGEVQGDLELQAELELLLEQHRNLDADQPVDYSMPTQIGPYRILAEIGRGGMGTVYKAEQREPVRRLLALKVVQAGLGTKEVLARFHIERKALAAMNHRHIAKVFDAGATEQGQPYFAMELVEGLPLGTFCDQHKLSLPQRLKLFQQICEGVQHAHQKGIVHRDLKPGNVLVVHEGKEAVPKILDFGLAKATDRDFVDATVMTQKDQILGTYEYMSPEQAHGDSDLVDVRADIYSLGVMLYELLCGELPFPTDMLRKSGRLEALRLIREQEPPKPSAKLVARPDRAALAALRQTSVSVLHKALRGDLDWVVLKAMAKEPERRYAAATLLAADLQRYLDHEPVLASPPSVSYRVHKFVRRYRVQCSAAAAVLVAIVGGGVGTWLGFSGKLALERAEKERNQVFADAALLAEARTKKATLYPAWPAKIPDMQSWLDVYGEPLAARLPKLEADLAALRSKARVRAAESHEPASDVATRQRLLSDLDQEDSEARRAELADQLSQLELEAEIRAFDFADRKNSFVHTTLTRLVRDLEKFAAPSGSVASVRECLARASNVLKQTIEGPRAKWNEAIAAIAASDGVTASTLYEHLAIAPQLGLVPLGMDPASRLWEFVHLASGAPGQEIPVRDARTHRLVANDGMGVVFVLLPGGKLPVADGQHTRQRHSLRLDPFFFSKYELTEGQVLRLTRRTTQHAAAPNLVLPAVHINWFDCRDMLRNEAWLLPTAMQWEYGCRAGTSTRWWTGSIEQSLVGKESPSRADSCLPVGSLAPNPFGLFDTLGNVWEWCRDECSMLTVVDGEHGGDGLLPAFGSDSFMVHKGSFDVLSPTNEPPGQFIGMSPSTRYHTLGVRPSRKLFFDHHY